MTMLLRSLWASLRYLWCGDIDRFGSSELWLRVWPGDLDFNLHMNNGRYFSIADLGRVDLGQRSRLWRDALKRGWRPMAGAATGRFLRSLQPFARYRVRSCTLGWDEKWVFCEHRFIHRDQLCAIVVVRYLFVAPHGAVPPRELLSLAGPVPESPALPDWVQRWHDAQESLTTTLKAERARSAH